MSSSRFPLGFLSVSSPMSFSRLPLGCRRFFLFLVPLPLFFRRYHFLTVACSCCSRSDINRGVCPTDRLAVKEWKKASNRLWSLPEFSSTMSTPICPASQLSSLNSICRVRQPRSPFNHKIIGC
ncbi:hypothetical protein LIPSTDRAFT_172781 [Lipomyces starkeyi NRRL Y-11557]|uniref:Uncharacterized protein n=1 Tax=Lipomyces starkeyi NRRL Y-11557 TaxID=675824 RepID=A0A1E3PXE7_LIPST|nr:hypothetical protein LIPSTDRAFT_172781 [Lipomyces starkeyi NRRL Y-11557]